MKKYIIILLFLFNYCAVMNTNINETAETLKPGEFKISSEVSYSSEYLNFLETKDYGDTIAYLSYFIPIANFKFRIGIKENMDIGASFWGDAWGTMGSKFNLKYRILKDENFSIAFYPGINFAKNSGKEMSNFAFKSFGIELPLITSYRYNKNFITYFAFKYGYNRFNLIFYDYYFDSNFYLGINNIHHLSMVSGFSIELKRFYWQPEIGFIGRIKSDGIYPVLPIMSLGVGWKF